MSNNISFNPSALDTVLLKPQDALTNEDYTVIKDNKDKLLPDEQERFKDLFPKTEAPPQEPKALTQDDLMKFWEDKKKEIAGRPAEEPSQAQVDKVEAFLKSKGDPKNWTETFKLMASYIKENPDEFAGVFKEKIESMTKAEQEKQKEMEKKGEELFNSMYKGFAESDPSLPRPRSKEANQIIKEVAVLMNEYNTPDFSKMFNLYKQLHPQGVATEGSKDEQSPVVDKSKEKQAAYRKAAGMIGGSSAGSSVEKGGVGYKDIAGAKTLNQIREMMLKKVG